MRSLPYVSVMALTVLAGACEKPAPKAAAGVPDFHNPADPGFAQQAPDSFRVRFSTTKGEFVVMVHRAWAPRGADRFYNLVRSGFYDGLRFFRVLPGFMAQFGILGDNNRLDASGFAPFGQVVEGMNVVDALFGGYGEGAPNGRGPDQYRLNVEGEKYLARQFPKLDKINKATVE